MRASAMARSSLAPTPYIGFADPLTLGEKHDDRSAWAKQACPPTAPLTGSLGTSRQAAAPMRVKRLAMMTRVLPHLRMLPRSGSAAAGRM